MKKVVCMFLVGIFFGSCLQAMEQKVLQTSSIAVTFHYVCSTDGVEKSESYCTEKMEFSSAITINDLISNLRRHCNIINNGINSFRVINLGSKCRGENCISIYGQPGRVVNKKDKFPQAINETIGKWAAGRNVCVQGAYFDQKKVEEIRKKGGIYLPLQK